MKLVFVYNADSGKLNTLFDIVHKVVSPDTYACSLCTLTHGVLSETKKWRNFRETVELDMEFLHRDEFEREYGTTYPYPVVLTQENSGLNVLLSPDELALIKTIDSLIEVIRSKTS